MKLSSFLGGSDEQRSNNLSDDKLINLYPTTNNDGSVSAFYKVDGLKSEGTLSGVPTGAYKASNGRAFYTSGTTLYELTVPAGVYTSTSRGTITSATNYEMSDNGIEMILVNGIDGWIFTFSDNSLKKLIVINDTFTLQNATSFDVDATLTKVAHGLVVGDRITLTTTGAFPAYILDNVVYYVLADSFTVDSFKIGLTLTGDTCTISNGANCTVTAVNHGYVAGTKIRFLTTGTLPASLAVGTIYYVMSDGLTLDSFRISATIDGVSITTTTAGTGVHSFNPAITIIQLGTTDCTITIAGPVIVTTVTPHNLTIGEEIKFKSTGSLPTGLIQDTIYYVTSAYNCTFSQHPAFIFGYPWLGVSFTDPSVSQGMAIVFSTNGTMPTGLTAGSTYYLGYLESGVYTIASSPGGTPIVMGSLGSGSFTYTKTNSFSLVTSLDAVYGTRITTSGTQSGIHSYYKDISVAYGTHTFTTDGYGFPSGCKQVKYMNGRFIASEPNTQNFYVSEVLDGKTWLALNVQTVDSNPDYVTGYIVTNNELKVFCENSGETYYDSGTTPTPFVRNLTGIFEVGCKAPYTIQEIGGAVIFLGNSNSGNGIVYRMAGLTPVRISTYSIEYQIQQMSDISDARAFTYQKDGHHFYVLTFPTGDKTFVFDASTSLWHERQSKAVSSSNGTLSAITDYATGVGPEAIIISSDGISVYVTNSASNTVSMYVRNIATGTLSAKTDYATGTTPYSGAISQDGVSYYLVNSNSNTVSMYARSLIDGTLSTKTDYATGTNPRSVEISQDGTSVYVTNGNSDTISMYARNITTGVLSAKTDYATGSAPYGLSISSDGISVYVTNTGSNTISMYARNITTGTLSAKTDYATGAYPFAVNLSDDTNSVYVVNYNSNTVSMYARSLIDGTLSAKTDYATGTNPRSVDVSYDGTSVYVINGNSDTISAFLRDVYFLNGKYTVNKYLYYNNKHLTTDSTTSLLSIDSSIYKDGVNDIEYVRSFRAPESDMKQVSHNLLELEAETGVGATTADVISMRWSNDNGNTWSTPITKELGTAGDYARLIRWHRLGATKGYQRIYEISGTSNTKIVLLAAYLS